MDRPASAASFPTSCIAAVFGLVMLEWLEARHPGSSLENGMAACAVIALVITLVDVFWRKVYRHDSTGLQWNAPRERSVARVGVKLIGFAFTLAPIALVYWVVPEYDAPFYEPFWALLRRYGVWLLAIAPLYFWWLDGPLERREDSYWEVGRLLAGQPPSSWQRIRQHYAGWAVKAFFLPLMVVYLSQEVNVAHVFFRQPFSGFGLYDFCFHLTYLLDLVFGVIGYCCTFRIVDSHIRSTEPTALGWLAALMCYQPFFSLVDAQYLKYEDGVQWVDWLAGVPALRVVWGAAIIALLFVYAASTMAFGLRFSNLTHRGIITSGPYRFTKHPAYVAKNLSWWLISVPFIAQGGFTEGLRNCLALFLLNLLYYLRARTEERHLSRDSEYVAYAQWIERHGIFRGLRRLMPAPKIDVLHG